MRERRIKMADLKYSYKLGIDSLDIKLVQLCRILSYNPQTIDEITDKMYETFKGKNRESLKDEVEFMIGGLVDNNILEVIKP